DRHTVELHAPDIVAAAIAIGRHLSAGRTVIAIKKHYTAAVAALEAAIQGTGAELYLSESFYPAGDEQNLVYCVTGRVVPTGGIPLDVGCVVSNASTVWNISQALEGQPVVDKMVTVAGSVAHPVTVSCAIGTPLSELLDAAGGPVGDCSYIIGGPLMGQVTDDLTQPVTKLTGGLLAIPKGHVILSKKKLGARDAMLARAVCCQCSMCTQMCPRNAMGLNVQPHKAMRAFASGNGALVGDVNGVFSCCDCGVCTYYACNFGLKPGKVMQQAKAGLQKQGIKPVKEVRYSPDGGIDNKRVPTERLLYRLDLKKYDVDAPMGDYVVCDRVRIPLKMHIGAPDAPLVAVGDRVSRGQLIAEPKGMGANIHASIDGTVTAVTDEYIEIGR
ncbi:MAG: SLBB domain-containing protein, partial [Clostridiales bacterium]|nr:SLBB domain-containing protein [Clostridiales bacterium]